MKVLMFGWEFPPQTSGGLGTACYALTKGLARNGADVTFVVPFAVDNEDDNAWVHLRSAQGEYQHVSLRSIRSLLRPYMNSGQYQRGKGTGVKLYGENLYEEVARFSRAAGLLAKKEAHDVIHCHDWMTYPAGIIAKQESGKPLVMHIHNTVFDRSGLNPSGYEYAIEKVGFEQADVIVAISNLVKEHLIQKYYVPKEKIRVVHWGIDQDDPAYAARAPVKKTDDHLVLFVGRITVQKGPDYFMEAAKKVLAYEPKTKFIVVGDGDLLPQIIQQSIDLGISDKVSFNGWFEKQAVFNALKWADVFVMPSVSEPFGLVALEALKNGTPVIVSKQSGVAEIVEHCLKVDFWDTDELANKIVNVVRHPVLRQELKENGTKEVEQFTLDKPAQQVMDIYERVIHDV